MKFVTAEGKVRTLKNAKTCRVDWDKPSRSKFQTDVKKFLRKYWGRHVVFEELRVIGTRLSLDLYNANENVAVEVQGKQHLAYNPFFHSGSRLKFREQLGRDEEKLRFCERNGIRLVEIYPDDELSPAIFEKQGVIL